VKETADLVACKSPAISMPPARGVVVVDKAGSEIDEVAVKA
jgi:hypothetical protein